MLCPFHTAKIIASDFLVIPGAKASAAIGWPFFSRIITTIAPEWVVLEWGLLKLRSLISPLRDILIKPKYNLYTFNHVHICQMSLQLSCGDTCHIWPLYQTNNECFDQSEKLGKNRNGEYWLSNPHPCSVQESICSVVNCIISGLCMQSFFMETLLKQSFVRNNTLFYSGKTGTNVSGRVNSSPPPQKKKKKKKMTTISQTTFSNAFPWMGCFVFWIEFHLSLFLGVHFMWALVQVMAWRRIVERPLPEPMLIQFTDAYMRHKEEMS